MDEMEFTEAESNMNDLVIPFDLSQNHSVLKSNVHCTMYMYMDMNDLVTTFELSQNLKISIKCTDLKI